MKTIGASLLIIAVFLHTSSYAQNPSLQNRSMVRIGLGFWGGSGSAASSVFAGVQTEAKTGAFLGNLSYNYGVADNMAFFLEGGVVAAQANSSVAAGKVSSQASAVGSLLAGIRLYVPDTRSALRPFVSAGLGAFLGMEASNTAFSQTAHTENAFGGRLGVGVDCFVGNHLLLGIEGGYSVMTDFATPVSGRKNFSGAGMTLNFGVLF